MSSLAGTIKNGHVLIAGGTPFCLFQTCGTLSCLLPELYKPGRGGGRAGGGARPGGGPCGGGGRKAVGEAEGGGVGGSAGGAGMCRVVGGGARLGGGV